MLAFYTDRFVLPLPAGHRFPMSKYSRLRERCLAEGVLRPEQLREPPAATWEELALAHDADYLTRVAAGNLSALEQRRIGFPWSQEMVERSRRSAGATIAAARAALAAAGRDGREAAGGDRWASLRGVREDDGGQVGVAVKSEQGVAGRRWGVAVNLAGGTHHAHAGHGGGFCVFNDAAVAVRVLQREGRVARAAILDCDVHQGDGTAAIFATDPSVLTFSIHGARNFPFRKSRSTLDVELPDGAGDDTFLAALELHIPQLLRDFRPDLVVYLAGADPYHDDRYGRLALSKEGLRARDDFVLSTCRGAGVPVAVAMAGGYARDTEDTVDIHVATVRAAARLARAAPPVATG